MDWMSTNIQMLLGACVIAAMGIVAAQMLSELTKKATKRIFGEGDGVTRQRAREDELHEMLMKVLDRQTCANHVSVVSELQDIRKDLQDGEQILKVVDKHMRWTGRCIWMIGRELKITDLPEEPEEQ